MPHSPTPEEGRTSLINDEDDGVMSHHSLMPRMMALTPATHACFSTRVGAISKSSRLSSLMTKQRES